MTRMKQALFGTWLGCVALCAVPAMAQNPYAAWLYRRTITVNNANATILTNHQVRVTLDTAALITAGKLRADGGDLRFATTANVPLNHWVEPETINTTTTRIWLHFPSLPTGNSSVYAYYGQSHAASVANGDAVFEFFDGFDGAAIDTSKWTIVNATGWSVENGSLRGQNTSGRLASTSVFSEGVVLETRVRADALPAQGFMFGFWLSTANSFGYLWSPGNDHCRNNGSWVLQGASLPLETYRFGVEVLNATQVNYTMVRASDGVQVRSGLVANAVSGEPIVLGMRYDNAYGNQAYDGYWDHVFVRKYAASEPTATVGTESLMGTIRTISGRVTTTAGQGVDDVQLFFTPDVGAATTNGGYFTIRVPNGWSGTLRPELWGGEMFNPAVRTYTSVGANQANQNYTLDAYALWRHSRAITVHNPNPVVLTNYQVLVSLDTAALIAAGKMRADGGDLRFGDASGVPLSHWVEAGSMNTTTTRVWVKTATLAASGNTTIHAHYGQPHAASISSGEATFDFFDDFDGTALDTTKWAITGTPTMTFIDGVMQMFCDAAEFIETTQTFGPGVACMARSKDMNQGTTHYPAGYGFGRYTSPTYGACVRREVYTSSSFSLLTSIPGSMKRTDQVTRNTNFTHYTVAWLPTVARLFEQEALIGESTESLPQSSFPLNIGRTYYSTAANRFELDWILVRSYAATEPTATLGTETSKALPWTISGQVTNRLGFGVSGVDVWLAKGVGQQTDASGEYAFEVPSGWHGLVVPEYAGAVFTPTNRLYANVAANQAAQNYLLQGGLPSYTNWIFSREIRIGNPGTSDLTDHQVLVEVDTAALIAQGKLRLDGGDIRFVDSLDRPLDYWVEPETVDTARTRMWVKVPLLPAGQTTIIYLRHGQPAATSAADGDKVFEFFDGFDSASIDTSKWTIVNSTGWSVTNGSLRGVNNMGRLSSISTFSQGVVLETRMRATALAPHGHMVGGFWKSTTDNYGYLYYPTTDYMANNGSFGAIGGSLPLNEPYRFTVETISASQVNYAVVRASDGLQMKGAVANNAVVNESVVLGQRYNNTYGGFAYDGYWDHVFVRKYAATEPVVTQGEESTGGILSYVISGAATNRWGQGIDGVRIGFGTHNETWTTNGGFYSFRVARGWVGTATPSYSAGGTFTPSSIGHSSVTADKVNQNYRWVGPTYALSGTVRNQKTGAGIGGVAVTLLPGPLTATTAASGTYTMQVEHVRSGTLTAAASSTGTYSPTAHAIAPMTGPVAGMDFNWLTNNAVDADTILLIHSSAANGSTAFADSSAYAHEVGRTGDVAHRTATKAIGTSSIQFDGQGDALVVPDADLFDLGGEDFTMDLWVRGDRDSRSLTAETLLAQWATDAAGFSNAANWTSYNAGSVGGLTTRGYRGAAFDGRYIYFVPYQNGSSSFHGIMLRFDTQGEMGDAASWTSYDAGNVGGLNTKGYAGAMFDGRYIYFTPWWNGVYHGVMLRYDTQGGFDQESSWSSYDAGTTDGLSTKGFVGASFDGRYIYFAPYHNGATSGIVLRHDTQGEFGAVGSWAAYDAGNIGGLSTKGYLGAVFDGRYVYFSPHHNGAYHANMLRLDTQGNFKDASSWSSYNAGSIGGLTTRGYWGAGFDGRYVYFSPYHNGSVYHGFVLRLDTQGDFGSASSWSSYNAGSVGGLTTRGYSGVIFDGEYMYFIPYSSAANVHHGIVLRYNTQGDFGNAASWSSFNAGSIGGLTTRGYIGGLYDGRHIYFTPYISGSTLHGNVLRYDTAPEGSFKLNWRQGEQGGAFSAVPPGLTFTLGAGSKAYTLAAKEILASNEWRHVAVTRHGPTLRLFLDGEIKDWCDMGAATVNASPAPVTAGAGGNVENAFAGHLDEIRMAKGTARWTGPFAGELPTEPYPDAPKVVGRVRHAATGEGVDGVQIAMDSWSVVTAGGGFYTGRVAYGWSGTIEVSHPSGGLFTPTNRILTDVQTLVNGQDFHWTAPPVITGISPSSGLLTGGVVVFIDGTDFLFEPTVPRVYFGGVEAVSVVRVNNGRLMVTTPAGAELGWVVVRVVNPNGLEGQVAAGFRYMANPPVIESVEPARGPSTGGTSVEISGHEFSAGQPGFAVAFGSATGTVVAHSATNLAVVAPPHAVGAVNVRVTNPDGQYAVRTNAFIYDPVISGRVTNALTGEAIAEAVATAMPGGHGTATGVDGTYALTVPLGWTGSVSVQIPGMQGTGTVTPASRSYSNLSANPTNQHYAFTPAVPIISGTVWNEDTEVGQDGVTVTFSGGLGSLVTSNGGQYALAVPYTWTGTVSVAYGTPYGPGSFTPSNHVFANVRMHRPETDFLWKPPYYPGTRYVSLTGLNEHPYTNLMMAARDIQTAVNAAGPGDLILVADGTYNISKVITVSKPVTVRSINGPQWAVVQRSSGNTGIFVLSGSNAVLDGFTIQNGRRQRASLGYPTANTFGTAGGAGVYNGAVIMNSVIRHNVLVGGFGGGAGLDMNTGGQAINCAIYGNASYYSAWPDYKGETYTGGARLRGNARLINCVVYGNTRTGGPGSGGVCADGTGYVDNSIIWGNSGGNAGTYYFGLANSRKGTLVMRSTTYQDLYLEVYPDDASMRIDPLFVSPSNHDFRLQPDSLAINSGVDAYNPLTNDLARNPRFFGRIDRGVLEGTNVIPRVTGRVTNEYFGTGVAGVALEFSGYNVITSGIGGWYGQSVPTNWTGTVTPAFSNGWFLAPPQRALANVVDEVPEQLFTWRPPHPIVSGRVTHQYNGTGLDGATVSFSADGGSTVTTNGGYYSHVVTGRWTGVVSVTHPLGGGFTPATVFITNIIQDRAGLNFVWNPPTRLVSGRVTHAHTGEGVNGVAVGFTASGGSSTTTNGGYYQRAVYYDYTGRATPSLAGGTFANPAFRDYTAVTQATGGQDYVWTPINPTISGRITNVYNGVGRAGITVTFSNGGGTTTTGPEGWYTNAVPWGWSGSATPSYLNGTFQLSPRNYTSVQANQVNQHFRWIPEVRTISGRLTNVDGGTGLDGVVVSFSGGGGTATTAGGGYYTRNLYYSWSGTASPAARPGGAWLLTSRSYGPLAENQVNQDFTWATNRTISGRVTHGDSGMGVAGVAVELSTGGSATTGADGTYSLTVWHGWSGRATPAYSSGSFVAPYRDYANVSANQVNQDYEWRPPRTVSGRVTNTLTGAGIDGVTVTFSGGAGTATTMGGGYYARNVLQGWAGTATPSREGHAFTPASRTLAAVWSDQAGVDFSGTPVSATVSGRVTHAYTGLGIPGRVVAFSNGGGSATTDAEGYYGRTLPYNYSGMASLTDANGSYAPASRTYTALQSARLTEHYVYTPVDRTISGMVTNADTGEAMAGVAIQVSTGGSVTTDVSGAYSVTTYHGWTGSLTPTLAHGLFITASRSFASLPGDQAGQNFAWYPPRVISGMIQDEETGEGAEGAVVSASGVAEGGVTDGGGSYQLEVPHGWSGTVTPSQPGYVFTPGVQSLANVTGDLAEQDFLRRRARAVSGRIVHRYTEGGIDGVAVTFGAAGTTMTTNGGTYEHLVPYGWTGTATPGYASGSFTPTGRSLPPVIEAVEGVDFQWTPPDPVVSGRVLNDVTGAGVAGVVVTFSGAGTATTVANGTYSRSVPYGWSGTISPSHAEGTFLEPASLSLADVTANAGQQNFTWVPPDPVISGRVTTGAGTGMDDIVIAVAGGDALVTTNGGYFSTTVPLQWTGTLTAQPPSASGVFVPESRSYSNLVVHRSNQTFVWQEEQVISGRITNVFTGDGVEGFVLEIGNGVDDAVTDAEGYYSATVPPAWSGTVRPVADTGTFSPVSRTYSGVVQPQAGHNYTWTPPIFYGDRYVSPAGAHVYPFTNWATAARTLHAAVAVANPGEIVWVTNGTYQLATTLSITKAIRVRSMNGAVQTVLRAPAGVRLVSLAHANAEFRGFTLEGADTAANGAGALVSAGYLHSCIIRSNRSTTGAGGVRLEDPVTARLANNLLYANTGAGGAPGAIGGEGTVINCTVADNLPAGLRASVVYNTISDGPIVATEVRYSLTPNLQAGLGNRAGDPRFVMPAARDYRLQGNSPALDAGHNNYNVLPFDLDYRPRVLNIVDMGAYERAPPQGLALALASDPNPVPRGDEYVYYLTVVNGGPGMALGVVVTASLPSATTYLDDSAGGAFQMVPGGGTWTIGSLATNGLAQMTIRVRADQPGYWTNGAVVAASQADPSEPGYDRAECVTRILDDVVITNLAASTSSGNSTVKWDSVVGMGYSVYSSDDPVGPQEEPNWEERATMVASEQIRDFLDTDTASSVVSRRYYQVTFSGREPTASNMWALVRRDVRPAGYTLVSPPVRMDRRFDGELGAALAEVLTGHNGGIGSAADEVYVLEGTNWRQLYLDASKTWREADGEPSTYALPAGQGFWVARKSGVPARITFTGPVGNDGTGTLPLQPGFNLLGLSEGRDLPLAATLATAQPVGGAVEEAADLLVIQQPNGAWRFLMFVTNWGAPYDGKWFDLSTYQIVPAGQKLEPGAAYYYLRRDIPGQIQF